MKLEFQQYQRYVTATLTPEEHDRSIHGNASIARNHVTFEMPKDYRLSDAHPDLLALAAYVICSPWVGRSLTLPFPVSQSFADATKKYLRIETTNISTAVTARETNADSRPGLAFSAGVDSIAALALMPQSTIPVFTHRAPAYGVSSTLYRDDAPLHAIEQMNIAGKETLRVTTDLEWLRNPVGFGVDPSPAAPMLLLGDYLKLDAVAFGTIAEAAYRTGTEHFIDYAQRGVFTKWQAVFKAAGIDYYNCVAPLSELCTTKIARESRFGWLAQSCVRGNVGRACMNCVKCFRKSLVEAAVGGGWPDASTIGRMMASRSVKSYLEAAPIRLEIVLMAALAEYEGDDPLLLALQKRVEARAVDVSFVRAAYGPGLEVMVPDKYRQTTMANLSKYVDLMSLSEQHKFESFDIRPKVERAQANGLVEEFRRTLDENQAVFAVPHSAL